MNLRLLTLSLACSFLVLASQPLRSEDFHGFPCTVDCSGHAAGYNWAEENNVNDTSGCGGNSQSFIEGCEAYATEHENDAADQNDPSSDSDGASDSSE